jgi:predicted extracellular nuclease
VGGIDVGFLVRPTVQVQSVTQHGKSEIFDLDGSLLNDRPPLVLRGSYVGNGKPFPIVVIDVHQRSLNGIDGTSSSADRVRRKRKAQAESLAGLIQATQASGTRLVVLGDFNAFEFTDGYVDVMGEVTGNPDPRGALIPADDNVDPNLTNQTFNMPPEERYSFIFDGSAQSLDHAITSASLDPWVRDVMHARGNADSPGSFEEEEGTALRSADHDGTVLYLMTDQDADNVADDLDRCPDTRIPERVPTVRLLPNHYALVTGDDRFDTVRFGRTVPSPITTADTRGCSCEQIIDRLRLGKGLKKYGCDLVVMTVWMSMP